MNDNELFLLHPIAYSTGQGVIAAEVAMMRRGIAVEHRVGFLQSELDRLNTLALTTLSEAWVPLFDALNKHDFVFDFEAVRARFDGHGFTGSLREIRNQQRRLGIKLPPMDGAMFFGGCLWLSDDIDFTELVERLFKPRIEQLLALPTVTNAEADYNAIMNKHELLSARDYETRNLAMRIFGTVISEHPELLEFTPGETRDFVRLYSQILDVSFIDIMLTLISNGGIAEVRKQLHASITGSAEIYRQVLSTVIQDRITAIIPKSEIAAQENKKSGEVAERALPNRADDLLTIPQVMSLMQISRTKLHRLVQSKVITPIHIGRAVRFERNDIDRYLGR